MAGIKDQMKMVRELQKAQKELKKEIIEVEAGEGAVVIQFTGELKVKSVKLDPILMISKSLNIGFKLQFVMASKKHKKQQPKKCSL